MKLIRTENYAEMSLVAGKIIVDKVRSNPSLTLGLATGSTPKGVYDYLIEDYEANGTSYKQVQSVNLD
jgi:glucosamine-6-phosphate deaminase